MPENTGFKLKIGKRKLGWVGIALLIIATGATASARSWFGSSAGAASTLSIKSSSASARTLLEPAPAQAVAGIVRLAPGGFNPTEISGSAGSYRLAVTNSGGGDQLVIRLKRASGELVQEIAVPQDKPEWTSMVELGVGSYTLTEANHPEWVCSITVQ